MDSLQSYITQIPIRHDLISSLLLAGIIQGIILTVIILSSRKKHTHPLWIYATYCIVLLLPTIDHYLCYTGLMKHTLPLNDATETFPLLIGPGLYFILRSVIEKVGVRLKRDWIHFVIPILYFISQIGFLIQGREVKLSAYLNGFHPDIEKPTFEVSPLLNFSESVKDNLHELVILLLAVYLVLSIRMIYKNRNLFKKFFQFNSESNRFSFSKSMIIMYALIIIIVLITFITAERDESEHFIFLAIVASFYINCIMMLRESKYLTPTWVMDKYETSGLNMDTNALISKINIALEEDSFFLDPACTLGNLSERLNVPANYISQVINQEFGEKFRDHINKRRVQEAQLRLNDPAYAPYTITSVGESVGFNSKSAFYGAFKKHVGMTPATYKQNQRSS